jgi:hypothetical protein
VTFSWCSSTTQAATRSFTPSDARSKRPRPQGGSAFQKSQTVKSLTARRQVLNSNGRATAHSERWSVVSSSFPGGVLSRRSGSSVGTSRLVAIGVNGHLDFLESESLPQLGSLPLGWPRN